MTLGDPEPHTTLEYMYAKLWFLHTPDIFQGVLQDVPGKESHDHRMLLF